MKIISKKLVIIPLLVILLVSLFLVFSPDNTYNVIGNLRVLIGDVFSSYYLILGLAFFLIILGISLSKYGKIKLGSGDPQYSTFSWGAMIFTSTMAADLVFYSFHEWSYYFSGNTLEESQELSATYPLFHWGAIPWAFYILPAMAYAYIMHCRKRNMYRLSQACDIPQKRKFLSTIIDIFALLAMLAATATTFSLATPLMSEILCNLLGIGHTTATLTILILLLIAITYLTAVIFNMKGISVVARYCIYIFLVLVVLILCSSNIQYTIETSLSGLGNMVNDFISMSTRTGSLRLASSEGNTFVQDYTVFYWSYWISWSLCTPLFIARISKGRTIRQVGLGALLAGILGTFTSFFVFGNFGLYHQVTGEFDMVGMLASGETYASAIVSLISECAILPKVVLLVLFISMLSFYASTFDTLTLVMSQYTCKRYLDNPPKYLKVFWGIVFILLPIALLFTEGTTSALQSMSIIAALPISIIFIRIIYKFFINLKSHPLK